MILNSVLLLNYFINAIMINLSFLWLKSSIYLIIFLDALGMELVYPHTTLYLSACTNQENEWSCISVLVVSILPVSMIFGFDFGTVLIM